jgi:hypothetical protein
MESYAFSSHIWRCLPDQAPRSSEMDKNIIKSLAMREAFGEI